MSAMSKTTVGFLMRSHVASVTEETPRPLPYRTRRRRAGWFRLGLTAIALAAFALPLIGGY